MPRKIQPVPLPDSEWFSVRQIAGHINLAPMTIYRLVQSGEIPATRVGRSFRIPAQAWFDYVKAQQVVPSGEASGPAEDEQKRSKIRVDGREITPSQFAALIIAADEQQDGSAA